MGTILPMSFRARRRFRKAYATRLLLAVAVAVCASTAHAASAAEKPEKPEKVDKPIDAQVLRTPAGLTEVGTLDGAPYRIDVPANWNHSLVVFYHGYALRPTTFHIAARLDGQPRPFYDRHYAVIQSAYSRAGWALEQAYPETESLRRYFLKTYGQPAETYVTGSSMGGELVAITLEINPKPYLGGLNLCGSVGPTYEVFGRRFAMRAAFDAYFPDVMPSLVPVPITFEDSTADRDKVFAALRANPAAATLMRNLTGLHSDADLAHDIAYWTFEVGDLQRRAGGNPFDNRNTIYSGTNPTSSTSDADLNEKVKRYAAMPRARDYVTRHFTTNGHLGRPMLALHTIYDPVVQVPQLELYDREVQAAGSGEEMVQQFVDREGHCNFTQDEIGQAFDEMVRWTHGGPRPSPGLQK
jgi:hypothetical protein